MLEGVLLEERLVEKWLPLAELNIDALVEVGFKGARMPVRSRYEEAFGIPPMVVGPRPLGLASAP